MALPKYKISKSNSKTRKSSWKAKAPELGTCPSCGKARPSHTICPHCGFYKGHQFNPRRREKREE
ncbi:MAG: 50S ribosomal protein L32 [bacterium]|nr:50S ribosomal protein L32 [bacterium]